MQNIPLPPHTDTHETKALNQLDANSVTLINAINTDMRLASM